MTDHHDVNVALAKALGLDTGTVIAFTVDVDKDRFPIVTATYRNRTMPEVAEDFTETYRLVPIEGDARVILGEIGAEIVAEWPEPPTEDEVALA